MDLDHERIAFRKTGNALLTKVKSRDYWRRDVDADIIHAHEKPPPNKNR